MKGYDFESGDTIVVDGTVHYWMGGTAKEKIRANFPGREDLIREVDHIGYTHGIECSGQECDILETNDEYAVLRVHGYLGVFIADKRIFDEYITILEIISAAPAIPQNALLGLLGAAV